MNGLNEVAVILDIDQKSNRATIQLGDKRLTTQIKNLMPASNKDSEKVNDKIYIPKSNVAHIDSQRIDLRGKRVNEAIQDLDIFLDRAILSNIKVLDVLHGKGTGALQEAIHDFLKNVTYVKKYGFAPVDQGGAGITIVEIS